MKPSILAIVALLSAAAPALAQPDSAPAPGDPAVEARRTELDAVARDIELTEERKAALQREIDNLDKDRASLNAALVEGGQEVQRLEGEIDATEARLTALLEDEGRLRTSLGTRRGILAEVLAALQRLGHRPPPAILVRPEDALASIRSAILLGAVVPELRVAANAIAEDLRALVAVRENLEDERDRLLENATALAEGRTRIALLIEERQRQRSVSVDALAGEERRAASLAEQAASLKELIARMESEIAAAAEAAAEAEKAAVEAAARSAEEPARSLGEAGRLAPAVAFAKTKGLLPLPVNGEQTIFFGGDDGLGGEAQGISIRTRSEAQVSSPADGWVVYAGPFRSYGQLLIINAGDGYHVLLAGMERIDVQLGQFVLAGEPVAFMASQRLASIGAADVSAQQPVLYVEFRKDGASIDPAPWWAASNEEKVGG
jgi:septal ring factor EnvC (AmiA/AmiB activator)